MIGTPVPIRAFPFEIGNYLPETASLKWRAGDDPANRRIFRSRCHEKGGCGNFIGMPLSAPFKSLLVALLRLVKGKLLKEVSTASGLTVKQLGGIERGDVKHIASEDTARVLTAMACEPAEVVIMSACLEGLAGLDEYADPAQAAAVEEAVANAGRRLRRRLRSLGSAEAGEYPAPYEVEPDRAEALAAWERLKDCESLAEITLAVRGSRDFQRWAFVELLCDESARAAAKDATRARNLAVAAVQAARLLHGRVRWRRSLLGYALAHLANALRVAGDLEAACRMMAAAQRQWRAGEDPDQLLDPGRLLDLEASLRRAQRRFAEALQLLKQTEAVTRRPEHVALKTASTLAVMGDYHGAIAVLRKIAPRIKRHPELRLRTIHRFNLAVAFTHVGFHKSAARLLPSIRRLSAELGDDLDRIRVRWLEGRIAAGLGEIETALLALAKARGCFSRRGMHYDAALSLLETAALLLERGDLAEVCRLAGELAPVFESHGVHHEAETALRLFEEAAARQAATAELARRLLAFLFRAQDDRGLSFEAFSAQEPWAPQAGLPSGSRMQPSSIVGDDGRQ